MVTDWQEFDLDLDGTTIHVHRAGDPQASSVVLAHGFTDSGACWRSTIDSLRDRFDVVAPDARHHGRSASPNDAGSDQVDDLIGVVARLDLAPVRLVGHSMGARTAAELAARRPDLVDRLVLEDPPWRPSDQDHPTDDGPTAADLLGHLRSLADMSADDLARLAVEQHGDWPADEHPDWVAAKQQVRAGAATMLAVRPWGPVVDGLRCPTLLVHGESALGGLVSADVARAVTERNPLVHAVRVPGAGHNIRREQRAAFGALLADFLDR